MLYILPTTHGVDVPSTIMKNVAPQIDENPVILWDGEATAENARNAVLQHNPPYVFTTGHGLPCATTLQDLQPFISLAEPQMSPYCKAERNLDIVKGRVWHVHSCWCGLQLAQEMVRRGAWAVFAHDKEFLFLLPKAGKIDIVTSAPFLAEFTVDSAMLSGMTAGEAQEAREKAYDHWLDYFLNGEGQNLDPAPLVARIVLADKLISKLYGDPTATVAKPGPMKSFKLSLPLDRPVGGSAIWLALPVALLVLAGR